MMTQKPRTFRIEEQIVDGVKVKTVTLVDPDKPVVLTKEQLAAIKKLRHVQRRRSGKRREKPNRDHSTVNHKLVQAADRSAGGQFSVNYKLKDYLK